MRSRIGWVSVCVAAAAGGLLAAVGIGSAGAVTQTVTLGSTSGTPSANICALSFNCTYVPYSGVSSPELQVPFDGTVTSFSVNAGSAGNTVRLRVLRPASGVQFTGAGTSQPQTLALGVNTFTTSLPVKAGDVLALDNSDSALIFDTSSANPITAYFDPGLGDGQTLAPNHDLSAYRLLLSATVQSASQTTTTTTPTTTTTTTTTTTRPTTTAPVVSHVTELRRVWREGTKLAGFSRRRRAPVGTRFSLALNEPAAVSFTFNQQLTGRKVRGRCVAQSHANRRRHACRRVVQQGRVSFSGHSGTNTVSFQGRISRNKSLPLGQYSVLISATNSAGQRSATASLSFTIVP